MKQGFEQWTEESAEHFLGNPVANGGNPQRTQFASAFLDITTQDGPRLKRPLLEVTHQRDQVLVKLLRIQLDADPIDAGFAFVALDRAKGVLHQRESDSPRERMVLDCQWFNHRSVSGFPAVRFAGRTPLACRGDRCLPRPGCSKEIRATETRPRSCECW